MSEGTKLKAQKTVLLCVTGGVAAYKACELVRLLQKRGVNVKVCMTEHACEFVGPVTFRALTQHEVAVDLFDHPTDPIHHISLAQEPDLVVVAPATANILAKMANGIADDLVSTTLLATPRPILVAPAMNNGMWEASATQHNVQVLRDRGVHVVGPGSGYLACGDVASGRMSELEEIADAAFAILDPVAQDLAGVRLVVTAGPTHEPIDPVRYIGNRSSGKMGIAIAASAASRGADVILVLGPTGEPVPHGVAVRRVQTAQEMFDETRAAFEVADAAICAAAVADYTPAAVSDRKLKKSEAHLDCIELTETKDILAALSADKGNRVVIGFAAETNSLVEYATEKLARKGCDAIVANDVTRADSGFGSDTDKAWWIDKAGADELPTLSKRDLAVEICLRLAGLLRR